VLDFVGMPATTTLGTGALCKGGHYVLCGLFGGEVTMSLPPIAQRGISIRGSYVGSLRELHEVVALAKTGRLAPPPIEVRPAAEASRSMEELRDGRVSGRVVLDFGSVEA
jgi:alcohol dehydrogenase/propanol-preferring alcohol dehydrogenase